MTRRSLAMHIQSCDKKFSDGVLERPTPHHKLVYKSVPEFRHKGCVSVLDFGCGRGQVTYSLGAMGFMVTGCELAPSVLGSELKKMTVFPFGPEDLSFFEDGSFDLVLLVDVVSCLRDEDELDLLLSECARLASKGVCVTLGENTAMQTIDRPAPWWRFKVVTALGEGCCFAETADYKAGVHRWCLWREAE